MANFFYSLPSVILLGICIGYLYKANLNSPLKDYFFMGLLAKFLAGIGLLIIYFKYYGVGDIISYYKDSVLLVDFAFLNPAEFVRSLIYNDNHAEVYSRLINQETSPRALLFVKVVALVMIITGKNYWIASLYFSLFSFIGFFSLANKIVLRFEKTKPAVIIALLLFPSMLIWTSGVVKEALSAGCIALLINYLFIITQKKGAFKWYHFMLSIFFVWVLWEIKYYIAAIFIPLAISLLLVQWYYRHREYQPIGLLLFGSILVGFGAIITFTSFNLHLENLPGVIYKNYIAFHRISDVQDVMSFPALDGSWTSVIYSAPVALMSGLFRPFINESGNIFQVVTSLENTLILLLFLFATPNFMRVIKEKEGLWVVAGLVFVFSLSIFLALSAPNFGTLVRYKGNYFFILVLLVLIENPIFKKKE